MNLIKTFLKPLVIIIVIGVAALVVATPSLLELRRSNRQNAQTTTPRPDIRITIVEGKRREEIARLLAEKGVCSEEDFLAVSEGREGYLFPDTYRFFPDTPAQTVLDNLLENFSTKTRGLNLTTDQLTLASIIEREAKKDEERPLIAGVYTNRLKVGMKLDADPTVQYAKDTLAFENNSAASFDFWKPITRDDYTNVQSPYNTYRQAGLPPGPIANPGIKSLRAAAQPSNHDYYYFFHKNNEMVLSRTLTEHIRNLNQ